MVLLPGRARRRPGEGDDREDISGTSGSIARAGMTACLVHDSYRLADGLEVEELIKSNGAV